MSNDELAPEREGETRSVILGALNAHKHVTDEESRTTQTLRLMPWYFTFFVTAGIMVIIALGEITGHVHAAAVAKSVVMRCIGGSVAGSGLLAYGTMRVRRMLRARSKTRSS